MRPQRDDVRASCAQAADAHAGVQPLFCRRGDALVRVSRLQLSPEGLDVDAHLLRERDQLRLRPRHPQRQRHQKGAREAVRSQWASGP